MMPYANEELIRRVDNDPKATDMERELAQRLDEVMAEVNLVSRKHVAYPNPNKVVLDD